MKNCVVSNFDAVQRQNLWIYDKITSYKKFLKFLYGKKTLKQIEISITTNKLGGDIGTMLNI